MQSVKLFVKVRVGVAATHITLSSANPTTVQTRLAGKLKYLYQESIMSICRVQVKMEKLKHDQTKDL